MIEQGPEYHRIKGMPHVSSPPSVFECRVFDGTYVPVSVPDGLPEAGGTFVVTGSGITGHQAFYACDGSLSVWFNPAQSVPVPPGTYGVDCRNKPAHVFVAGASGPAQFGGDVRFAAIYEDEDIPGRFLERGFAFFDGYVSPTEIPR